MPALSLIYDTHDHRPFHVETKDTLFNQPNIRASLTDIGLLANKIAF